ncbi:MAG: putative 4-mercaptohistidine N1-methyltransferase [Verrucomicrobiota bacterium]
MNVYETDKLLAEYLLFHYGAEDEILPADTAWPVGMREALGFPVRTVAHFGDVSARRGLDLGCAVGRSAFEMARICDEVTGIDFSQSFIRAAADLASGKEISYRRHDEGNRTTNLTARAPAGNSSGRILFQQGDAMNLPETLGTFDRVHVANLLCRLPEPLALLRRLPSLVEPGGILVLATPCTWLAEFTPPENWPAGSTLDWLTENLGASFDLESQCDEPFLIRETGRKFQWSRSLVTVWNRR